MHYFFLSCLKATELIEKKIYSRLSFKEKLQLKVHKAMCDACSNYEKDSLIIDKAIQKKISASDMQGVDLKVFEENLVKKMENKKQ